jgi:anti-sigma regulatory factor (Ser/Thr protein kinase)
MISPDTEKSPAHVFAARPTELGGIIDLVRTRCRQFGVAPDLIHRIELTVEELFANTIQHG